MARVLNFSKALEEAKQEVARLNLERENVYRDVLDNITHARLWAYRIHCDQVDNLDISYTEHVEAVYDRVIKIIGFFLNFTKLPETYQELISGMNPDFVPGFNYNYEYNCQQLMLLASGALLHDTLEDAPDEELYNETKTTIFEIGDIALLNIVDKLSHNDKTVTYDDYICSIINQKNPIISIIKMSDLEHNSNFRRVSELIKKYPDQIESIVRRHSKYIKAHTNILYSYNHHGLSPFKSDIPK